MAKAAKEKKASKLKAIKKNFKKEIINSLDAVFDKSVEELIQETEQAWKAGKSIACAPNKTE